MSGEEEKKEEEVTDLAELLRSEREKEQQKPPIVPSTPQAPAVIDKARDKNVCYTILHYVKIFAFMAKIYCIHKQNYGRSIHKTLKIF